MSFKKHNSAVAFVAFQLLCNLAQRTIMIILWEILDIMLRRIYYVLTLGLNSQIQYILYNPYLNRLFSLQPHFQNFKYNKCSIQNFYWIFWTQLCTTAFFTFTKYWIIFLCIKYQSRKMNNIYQLLTKRILKYYDIFAFTCSIYMTLL